MPDDGRRNRIKLVVFILVNAITQRDVAAEIFTVPCQVFVGHDDAVTVLLALQLGKGCQEIEHHTPGRRGSVYGLGDGDQGDVLRLENVLDDC